MSLREFDYRDGTRLRLRGNHHEGYMGVDLEGFNFDRAVTQRELIELIPEQCSELDLRYGNIYKVSLTANIPSFAMVNGDVGTYTFIFEQDATGGRTVTFDGSFYFPTALGAPDFSGDAGGTVNIVMFLYDKENFYGTYLQDYTAI